MTARRVTYLGARRLVLDTAEAAPPPPGHVRVDVAYTGICDTDLHIFRGGMDGRVEPPQVIGHEMSGRIAQVGDGAPAGGRATPSRLPSVPLPGCPACRVGHTHLCHRPVFLESTLPDPCRTPGPCPPPPWSACRTICAWTTPPWPSPPPWPCTTYDARGCGRGRRRSWSAVARRPAHRDRRPTGSGPTSWWRNPTTAFRGRGTRPLRTRPGRRHRRVGRAVDRGAGAAVAFEVSGAAAGVATAVGSLAARGRMVHRCTFHPYRARSACTASSGASSPCSAPACTTGPTSRRAVGLIAEGEIPAGIADLPVEPLDRAAQAFEALESGAGVMKVLIDCGADGEAEA